MRWLGVHFPALALEVFHPREVHGQEPLPPRVVVEDNRVMLRNGPAIAAGIAPGCTLATAHSLVSGLEHHRRQPQREAQRLHELGEILYRFSSQVSLNPPDGLMLEAGGSHKLFGSAPAQARQVTALCERLGHESRCGWAETPRAALLLARSGADELAGVPLHCMDLQPVQVERFANMGIHHLGQLLALPRRALAQRAGPELVDQLQRITGDLPDPQPCLQPAHRFHHNLHLLEPVNGKEALGFLIQRQLTALHHWLVGRQLGAELLIWHFAPSGGGTEHALQMPVRFARPQQSSRAFLGITRLRLDQAELPADVMSIGLEARRLRPWAADSRQLFQQLPGEPGSGRSRQELEDLVDELCARLGQSACAGIRVLDQHCPEDAWERSSPGRRPIPSQSTESPGNGSGPIASPRPLWLFEPPRPAAPEQLTLLKGPERIRTGWWRESRCRDYYVARHENGASCWVFVDAEQRWYLHGYFS